VRELIILSIAWAAVGCVASRGPMPPWVLVAPPYREEDGALRRDDRAPLREWDRLGFFEDPVACRQFRDEKIVEPASDDEWAMWSLARCLSSDRAEGGLPPDVYE